jgi:hypothetical protein
MEDPPLVTEGTCVSKILRGPFLRFPLEIFLSSMGKERISLEKISYEIFKSFELQSLKIEPDFVG